MIRTDFNLATVAICAIAFNEIAASLIAKSIRFLRQVSLPERQDDIAYRGLGKLLFHRAEASLNHGHRYAKQMDNRTAVLGE